MQNRMAVTLINALVSTHLLRLLSRVDFSLKEDFDNQSYILDVAMFRFDSQETTNCPHKKEQRLVPEGQPETFVSSFLTTMCG